jgi:hypothetical protein
MIESLTADQTADQVFSRAVPGVDRDSNCVSLRFNHPPALATVKTAIKTRYERHRHLMRGGGNRFRLWGCFRFLTLRRQPMLESLSPKN